jgi:asparagine synthase (glutamine-hydrolysing)
MSQNGVTTDSMDYNAGHRDILRAELEHSVTTSLRTLLRYEDRNSMAYSLESRVPFLTPGFASLLLSLPEEYLVDDNGMTKRVFRAAMRGIVPDVVLDRRDKIGFETPEQSWLGRLRHWTDPMLSGETARSIPVFNHAAAWKDWQSGVADPRRYRAWMWRWINLVRWTELVGVSY